ncbi:MAG: hypothetical protein AB8B97_19480 [Granulosicoccus sp.]
MHQNTGAENIPLRRALLSCAVNFWFTVYNTPFVVHLSVTKPNIGTLVAHQALLFCTVALANKARTALHYPLPLAIDDIGVAGCTTMCSFTCPHSRLCFHGDGA